MTISFSPRWPAITFAVSAFLLMQVHSIGFWQSRTNELTGIVWSVVLEGAALFLWWIRHRFFAVLASAFVIAGPFHQIAAPTLDTMLAHTIAQEQVAMEQAEVDQLAASLAVYEANSKKRAEWAGRIDRTQKQLDEARHRLRAALENKVAVATDWRAQGTVALEAGALLLVMVAQILAVLSLRQESKQVTDHEIVETDLRQELRLPPKAEIDYEDLVIAVAGRLESYTGQQKEIAGLAGVRAADLSMIRRHAERRAAGQETVSKTALRKLADYLGVESVVSKSKAGCERGADGLSGA